MVQCEFTWKDGRITSDDQPNTRTDFLKKLRFESKLGSNKVTIWVQAKVVHCFSVTQFQSTPWIFLLLTSSLLFLMHPKTVMETVSVCEISKAW